MLENFKIVRLTKDFCVSDFDCGNYDLNDFLATKAMDYVRRLLSVTYVVGNGTDIVAYFSLLNDKMSISDSDNSTWRKIKKSFPHSKHRLDYPAVKIGRLAVSVKYQGNDLGSTILDSVKKTFITNNRTGCAFITVDALNTAVPFYQKNGFLPLDKQNFLSNPETNLMYYDLAQLV